jgi:mevalonate kinase
MVWLMFFGEHSSKKKYQGPVVAITIDEFLTSQVSTNVCRQFIYDHHFIDNVCLDLQ